MRSSACRLRGKTAAICRIIQFACLFPVVLLIALSIATESGFAQSASTSDPPLQFGDNFFVTGDYVVAGAYGMTTNFTNVNGNTYAVGTINVPDLKNPFTNAPNLGNTGATSVPAGAQIVAAILYWQTVEKVGVAPGGPGSGQIGFFRPVFQGGPQTGYILNGVDLQTQNTVSFSTGGCTGGSTGKVVRTYRADVRGYLPVDSNGNVIVNGTDPKTGIKYGQYQVILPSTSSTTPITLGATLVLVYRVISPAVPLNAIVIYDGTYAPGGTLLNMTQTVQGFYQASANPVSRLTHIVGQGKSKKLETVSLNGIASNIVGPSAQLPSLYPGQPPFPGFYGSWDNPTWTFPYSGPNPPPANYPSNPLQENNNSATTVVAPSSSQMGCVSWGAVIVSTTVHDDDKDGILQVWKKNQGYTDVGTGQHVDLTDTNDPAKANQQDVFIQMDHVVALDASGNPVPNGDFTPDPLALSRVHDAFLENGHGVHLHINTGSASAHAIPEPAVTDGSTSCNGGLCPYPNQPGITAWRDGFEFVENYPLNYTKESTAQLNEADCEANSPPLVPIGPTNCVRRFPPQLRNSHHYVVVGDTLGAANWGLFGGTLTDPTGKGAGVVVQFNSTVTFYTSRGHGLMVDANAGNGRVTITGAITNPNLNGTYLVVQPVTCPVNPDPASPNFNHPDCSVSNKAPGPYTFTIHLTSAGTPPPTVCPGNANIPAGSSCYTVQTDPRLSIASGQAGSGSGFSDVGGAGTLVTLGSWPLAYQTVPAKAGTLMHELGHTLGLLHGGGDNTNCKSNYQSVMNYMFQTKLLGPSGVVDFSSQQLNSLNESALGPITTIGAMGNPAPQIAFSSTRWYDTKQTSSFKQAAITSFSITSNVVTFQALNTFKAGNMVQVSGLTVGTYLNGQVLTVLSAGLSGTQFEANFANGNVLSTIDSGTAKTTTPVPIGDAATQHCNGTPLSIADPPTYGYKGGTVNAGISSELDIPWSTTTSFLDINFEGGTKGSESAFVGYNDWANTDPRQLGASGNQYFGGAGFVPGGPGGGFVPGGPGGGFVPSGPGGGFVPGGPGGGFVPGGPGGGFVPGGPGGGFVPGGPGASVELDAATSVSVTDPPSSLTASPDLSPRNIHLSWIAPTFPQMDTFNIYRSSDNGATFSLLTSVSGTSVMYTDVVTCNPTGYAYFVTSVLLNTTVTPSQEQESTPSNTAPASTPPRLTGCYTNTPNVFPTPPLSDLAFPANTTFVHGGFIPITFSLQADNANAYPNPFVNNLAVNSLFLIGPYQPTSPGGPCAQSAPANTPLIKLLTNGVVDPNFNTSMFGVSVGPNYQFTYNLDSDRLSSGGCYVPNLQLSSGQSETTASPFLLQLDINDTDSTPHVATLALPAGTVGLAYGPNTLTEDGGTGPFKWVFTGSLPSGISQQALNSPTVTGTTCAAGNYNFTATVTDAKNNVGTQPFTLQINKANTTTGEASNANPSVFGQMVTFTVTVAPQYTCTPTGTVTLSDGMTAIASNLPLTGGVARFTTSALSVGMHNITASYGGDSNFNGSNSAILLQTVNMANTMTSITSVSPSPAVVGQAITVAYTLAVVPPGAGAPTGTVTVAASDGSGCVVPAAPGPGACVLSPVPTTAGGGTFAVTYSGDSNFFGSAANGNYTVYIPTNTVYLSRADYPTGANPDGMTAADFNGDGKLDLAIANSGNNTVTILSGNGDGTFTTKTSLATGAGNAPQLPIAGDFNGDGKLDLAVANFVSGGPSTVSIFLGNGDGTFQAPTIYLVGNGATSLVTGDFNHDGKLDLAVANQNDASVSILIGNGDGTFQTPALTYAAVPDAAASKDVAGVALGDFNRDGNLDLVVANPSNNTVSVLLGNGDGTFQAPVAYGTGNHPVNLAVADLNGDSILDLAVANLNDETVSILLGKGDGTFNPQASYPTTATITIGPVAVITGDFNGDGKIDLAITNQGDNTVSILLGNGDGTFQNPLEFPTGSNAAGLAPGDFNGDGRLDVAVADFNANTASIMLQVPGVLFDGTFNNSNWQVTNFTNTTTGVTSGGQVLAGGNPGAYRQIINTVGDAPSANCVGNVVGFHANAAAIYNPAQQGAITSIDYSEDSILISGGGDGQGGGSALMQGGQVYLGPEHVTPSTSWTHFTNSGLGAGDFSAVDQTQFCSAFVNSSQHPDFSASGAPIQFGFWRGNSTGTGGTGYTRIGGIDNWTVIVH